MVPYSVQAAEKLQNVGIFPTVFDFHTIKPLDNLALSEIANNFEYLVSIEEHSKIGGLGGAVAEYFADFKVKPKHLIIGLEDDYGVTADYFYLLEKYGLTGEGLSQKILDFLQNK
jgi:transketolase